MIRDHLFLFLFFISACFTAGTVAREAVVGGHQVTHIYTFLYQVSVQIYGHGHICGGGIIGEQFVLTAAHCVLNRTRQLRARHISVLAGTKNLNDTGRLAVTVQVDKVFFPLEFHPTVLFSLGDIAVLRLIHSLRFPQHYNLGKLEFPRNYYDGSRGMIAGFGWNEYNNGIGGNDGHLRFALTTILSDDDCENSYPHGAIESERQLCARPLVGRSVCTGDIGSPLISNRTIVIGILIRIPLYCDEGYEPGVYTRVAPYLQMIFNVMKHKHDAGMMSLQV